MSGPNDTDDGWAELARELGLEQTRPTPTPQPPPADLPPPNQPLDAEEETADGEFVPLESDGSDEGDDGGEFADDADGDADGDGFDADLTEQPGEGAETGEPGEPKKKRRRRRRRRKKGPGEPVAEGAEPAAVAESATGFDDDEGEPDSPEARVEEELPSPEASRELMANWDVPSWETIITTMLYRPGGR
jgi:hypothetical protein